MHTTNFLVKTYGLSRRRILDACVALKITPRQVYRTVEGEVGYVNEYTPEQVQKILEWDAQ